MADHIIGALVGGVSKTIAISSELISGQKGRDSARARAAAQDLATAEESNHEDPGMVQHEWELDAIEDELDPSREQPGHEEPPPDYSQSTLLDPDQTSNADDTAIKPLRQAVLIPQRRPGDRRRGFIRAYAPILSESKNIDQDMFLKFLDNLDSASRSSPVFDVINLACFGIGLVPDAICCAVSSTVGTANIIAQRLQIRYRTNAFLEKANETIFKPRNCFAMVMTYQPDMADEFVLEANTSSSTTMTLSRKLADSDSITKQLLRRLRESSGTTTELQLPQCATLVHPTLDNALTSTNLTDSKKSVLTKKGAILNDYLDRRAQTEFAVVNPKSKIAAALPSQQSSYVNRFADPNHPVNSGSIFGLFSGGTFDPIAAGRVSRAERNAKNNGQPPLTETERHEAYMGRKVRGRVTGTPSKSLPLLGKILKRDVLYLIIVELPTDEQMREVEKKIQELGDAFEK